MVSKDNATLLALDCAGYPKIRFSSSKCSNGLELVSCIVDNPLYSAYVVVPTAIKDNKGLPHTLEHLIFCGSEAFPERGYLDRLASLCQGAGTNAYTSEDHTCYTFTTCSLSGLLRLLPVFLDHIFRPTIDPSLILREVFYRSTDGQGKGVVYCEMASRQWSEQDQMDLGLRRGILKSSKEAEILDGYGWECGGWTQHLTRLTREEIVDYHRQYYNPENVTIILCGGEGLKEAHSSIISIMEQVQFHPRKNTTQIPAITDRELSSNVKVFPANDESLGSVGLAWFGPPSNDLYTITALHILMRMLRESSASPLYQEFVERVNPIATDIDYEIKPYYRTILTLIFSGVPTNSISEEDDSEPIYFLEEGKLKELVFEFLKEWSKDDEAIQLRLTVAMKSMTLKLQESLEDDPHELCASFCIPEIIRRHYWNSKDYSENQPYGKSLTLLPQVLEKLASEPIKFWKDLIERYIFDNPVADVYCHPSRSKAEEIKKWEDDYLAAIPPINLVSDIPPSVSTIPPVELTIPNKVNCQLNWAGQTFSIKLPNTGVVRFTLAKDTSDIPPELYDGFVLLQELLFSADVNITEEIYRRHPQLPLEILPIGHSTYQDLIERLESKFSLTEAAIGFDNELFSTGYLDSHFLISLSGRVNYSLEELRALSMAIVEGTVLEASRVEEVLENLNNQLKDAWRDPSQVLDALLLGKLYAEKAEVKPIKRSKTTSCLFPDAKINLFNQSEFLKKASQYIQEKPEKLIQMLEELQSHLVAAPYFDCIGCGAQFEEDNCDAQFSDAQIDNTLINLKYSLPKHGSLEGCLVNPDGTITIISMVDITASFLTVVLPINVYPTMQSDRSLEKLLCGALVCQLISYTEGPLYRRIRGGGLAYGASLSLSLWNGLLSFDLNDSTDPVQSLLVFEEMLRQLLLEAQSIIDGNYSGSILNEETLQTAKALQLYQYAAERSNPASIISTAFRYHLREFPILGSIEEEHWNKTLLRISLTEIAQWCKEYGMALLNPQHCLYLLAVPHGKYAEITYALTSIQRPFTTQDLSPYII